MTSDLKCVDQINAEINAWLGYRRNSLTFTDASRQLIRRYVRETYGVGCIVNFIDDQIKVTLSIPYNQYFIKMPS